VIGAGRIGAAYARIMVEGHKMNLVYFDRQPNPALEKFVDDYSRFLASRRETPVTWERAETLDALLETSDCISLHTSLNDSTRHLIDAKRLRRMKKTAILVNTSRGPVIDEAALVAHCRKNPDFRAGLDVFENEPNLAPGLADLQNVIVVPHIASATNWSRQGMAALAAANVAAMLQRYPAWQQTDVSAFLKDNPPKAAPSIVNADALGIARYRE